MSFFIINLEHILFIYDLVKDYAEVLDNCFVTRKAKANDTLHNAYFVLVLLYLALSKLSHRSVMCLLNCTNQVLWVNHIR